MAADQVYTLYVERTPNGAWFSVNDNPHELVWVTGRELGELIAQLARIPAHYTARTRKNFGG